MSPTSLEALTLEECLEFLRERLVGRLAVVADQIPVVLPVNYRLVETQHRTWIAIRSRPGNILDQAPTPAAFDSEPWITQDRDAWLVIEPYTITGRRLVAMTDPTPAEREWAFHPDAYL